MFGPYPSNTRAPPAVDVVLVIVNPATELVDDVIVGEVSKTILFPVPVDVPESVTANVPDVVIVDGVTENNEGTVIPTEDTYVVGRTYDNVVPFDVNTVLAAPTAINPVPPDVVGNAVPDSDTANVPVVVIEAGVTDRNDGTDIPTDDTYMIGVVHVIVPPAADVRKFPVEPEVVGNTKL